MKPSASTRSDFTIKHPANKIPYLKGRSPYTGRTAKETKNITCKNPKQYGKRAIKNFEPNQKSILPKQNGVGKTCQHEELNLEWITNSFKKAKTSIHFKTAISNLPLSFVNALEDHHFKLWKVKQNLKSTCPIIKQVMEAARYILDIKNCNGNYPKYFWKDWTIILHLLAHNRLSKLIDPNKSLGRRAVIYSRCSQILRFPIKPSYKNKKWNIESKPAFRQIKLFNSLNPPYQQIKKPKTLLFNVQKKIERWTEKGKLAKPVKIFWLNQHILEPQNFLKWGQKYLNKISLINTNGNLTSTKTLASKNKANKLELLAFNAQTFNKKKP